MEKITRKMFTEILAENPSVFVGSVFGKTDALMTSAMENLKTINENAERRRLAEKHANYIVFSNGSRLDFNQDGKNEYIVHQNSNGLKFIMQRNTHIERDWDAEEKYYQEHHNLNCGEINRTVQDYVVYAI